MTSRHDVLVLGSGAGGKLLSWHKVSAGRRTDRRGTKVDRRLVPQHQSGWEGSRSGVPKWPISSTTRRRSG
jgi:hypothetical protein